MKITNKENKEISIDEITDKLQKKLKQYDRFDVQHFKPEELLYLNKETENGIIKLPTATLATHAVTDKDAATIDLKSYSVMTKSFMSDGKVLPWFTQDYRIQSVDSDDLDSASFKIKTETSVMKNLSADILQYQLNKHINSFEKQYDALLDIHNKILEEKDEMEYKSIFIPDDLTHLDAIKTRIGIWDYVNNKIQSSFEPRKEALKEFSMILDFAGLAEGIELYLDANRSKTFQVGSDLYKEKIAILNTIYNRE